MALEFYVKVTKRVPWSALRDRAHALLGERLVAQGARHVEIAADVSDPSALAIGPHELDVHIRASEDAIVILSVAHTPEDPDEPLDTGWSAHLALYRTDEAFLLGMVLAAALADLMGSVVIDDAAMLRGARLRTASEVSALICPASTLREAARLTRAALALPLDPPT